MVVETRAIVYRAGPDACLPCYRVGHIADLHQLAVTIALSDEDVSEHAAIEYPQLRFARGFVHEVAAAEMTGKYANVRAYVAGPPPAVDATLRYLLRDAKLSTTEIRYDKFG
jgi:toluene monooxygenase electron transfer component